MQKRKEGEYTGGKKAGMWPVAGIQFPIRPMKVLLFFVFCFLPVVVVLGECQVSTEAWWSQRPRFLNADRKPRRAETPAVVEAGSSAQDTRTLARRCPVQGSLRGRTRDGQGDPEGARVR